MQISKILFLKIWLLFFASTLLLSCSPIFDWRVVRSDDLLYEAMYPAKPTRAEKNIVVAGQQLTMTMEAAKASDALYAVGVIAIPAARVKEIEMPLLLKFLEQGMIANLRSSEVPNPELVSVKTAGSPAYELPARQWKLQGKGPDQLERVLRFRLLQRQLPDGQLMVYQVGVLQVVTSEYAMKSQSLDEQHQTFFNGFKPY